MIPVSEAIPGKTYFLQLDPSFGDFVSVIKKDNFILVISDWFLYIYDHKSDSLNLIATYIPVPLITKPELDEVPLIPYPILSE